MIIYLKRFVYISDPHPQARKIETEITFELDNLDISRLTTEGSQPPGAYSLVGTIQVYFLYKYSQNPVFSAEGTSLIFSILVEFILVTTFHMHWTLFQKNGHNIMIKQLKLKCHLTKMPNQFIYYSIEGSMFYFYLITPSQALVMTIYSDNLLHRRVKIYSQNWIYDPLMKFKLKMTSDAMVFHMIKIYILKRFELPLFPTA